jgi:superfamily I DNA/RNA helicase
VVAAIELDLPFRAPGVELLVESPLIEPMLDAVAATDPALPLLARVAGATRAGADRQLARAVLGWAAGYRDLEAFRGAVSKTRARLAELRRDDALLTLATAHGTKGLEWDHVAVVGMEAGRFPSRRSIESAPEPARALEEERRLAYVAWTRARRSLTLLYDPAAPSPFLLEAFSPEELGLETVPEERDHAIVAR